MPPSNKKEEGSEEPAADSNDSASNICENDVSPVNDSDELTPKERCEEKLSKALENATEKSAQTRALALQSICEILMYRYMPDYVDDHKVTLIDCIEKSIRRGKGAEQVWGARLAPLLVLQLGSDECISKSLYKFLHSTIEDNSVSFDARAKCCTALGLLNFFGSADIGDSLALMQCYERIFSASYLQDDDKTPNSVSADAGTLHAEALSSWGLLLTMIPPGDFVTWMTSGQFMLPSFKKLLGLLQSPHLAVRMAAGETLALVYESGRAHDEDFLHEYLNDVIDAVKQLTIDSRKYRAKRDQKAQKATFRDVLIYLEEGISPKITIQYHILNTKTYSMILDSWALHRQYSALCGVMGPGMNIQLRDNDFIREVFALGPKPNVEVDEPFIRINPFIRRMRHGAAFKARTKSRAENRDKRSAVFN